MYHNPHPNPPAEYVSNNLERIAPYEFKLSKTIGGKVVSQMFHIRDIPAMKENDIKNLYDAATTGDRGVPASVRFVAKPPNDADAVLWKTPEEKFIARKISEELYSEIVAPTAALIEVHDYFTRDPNSGEGIQPEFFMGYDSEGNPTVIEIGEWKPDDFDYHD